MSVIGLAAIILESLRIKTGFLIVGQREYEKHQISALAWGAVSIALTIIALSPRERTGDTHAGWMTIPIILFKYIDDFPYPTAYIKNRTFIYRIF